MLITILEVSPFILALVALVPAIFIFLLFKMRENKYQQHFKELEKENLNLNSNILELEGEIVTLKKDLENYKHSAGIVRMDEKQKSKGVI